MDYTKSIPFVKSYDPKYTEVHTDSSDFEDVQYSFKQRIKKLKKTPDLPNPSKWKLIEDFHNQCNVENNVSQLLYREQSTKLKKCNLHINSIEERNSDPQNESNTVIRDDLTKKLFTNSQQKLKGTQQNFISYVSSKLQKNCKKNKRNEAEQNTTIDLENLYAIEPVLTIDGNLYGFPKKRFHEISVENMFGDPTSFSSCRSLRQKRIEKYTIDNCTQTRINKDRRHRYRRKQGRNDNERYVYSSSEFQSRGPGFDPCNASNSWRSNGIPSLTSAEIHSFCAQQVTKRPNQEKRQCKCGLGPYRCTSPSCPHGIPKPRGSDCTTQTQEFGTPNFPSPFPFATRPTTPTKPCCCSEKIQKFLQTHQNNQFYNTVYPQAHCNQINRNDHKHSNCTCPDPILDMKLGDKSLCQSPHEDVLTDLQNRYNRQVLCIHNPPCVLINGCLNVTRPSDQDLKPVLKNKPQTLPKKQVYNILGMKKKSDIDRKFEKGCQHHPPCINMNPYDRVISNKREKLIQGTYYQCPHCEMGPKSFKSLMETHDPNYPMVRKDSKRKETVISSWREEPTYMNYLANDFPLHATTQVKPKRRQDSGCHHKPPCIMVPRCLNAIIRGGDLPKDVMPGCDHQPPCQMVHACDIDGSKEMVIRYYVDHLHVSQFFFLSVSFP